MRILLVESEPRIIHFIAKGLCEQGYEVDLATEGSSACYLAAANEPDIVILGDPWPFQDPHSVCRNLRGADFGQPILRVTESDSADDRAAALDAGADDTIRRPFDFCEFPRLGSRSDEYRALS